MIIYRVTNKINGKIYIGQTRKPLTVRWSQHCSNAKKNRTKYSILANAIRKYGKENFFVEEIDGANDLTELNYREQHHIYMNNSVSPVGYNLVGGGQSVQTYSDETRKKMSDSAKAKHFSESHRLNIKKVVTGIGNPFYGKKHSDESKRKNREAHLGENSAWYGKTHSEETKRKMAITRTKYWERKRLEKV